MNSDMGKTGAGQNLRFTEVVWKKKPYTGNNSDTQKTVAARYIFDGSK
jgi:hypothetical protein